MRRLDWLLAAVIGVFLAGALMSQAVDWAMSGVGVGGHGGLAQALLDRLVSVGTEQVIARQAPIFFHRP